MKKKLMSIIMAFALICSVLFTLSSVPSAASTTIYFSSYAVSGGMASVDLTKSGNTWLHAGNLMTHGGDWVAKAISYDMGIPTANQDWSGMDTAVLKVGANPNYTGAQISAIKINGYTIDTGTVTVTNTTTGQDISVSLANVPNLNSVSTVSIMIKSDWNSIKLFSISVSGSGSTTPPTATPTITPTPTPTPTETGIPSTLYFNSYAVSGGVASTPLTQSGNTWQHDGNLMTHNGNWVAITISYDMGIPSANQNWSGMDTAVLKVGANANFTGAQISGIKINGYTIDTGIVTVTNTGAGQDISFSLANVPNLSSVSTVSVLVKSDWNSIKFFSISISGNGSTATPPPTTPPPTTPPPTTPPPTTPPPTTPPPTTPPPSTTPPPGSSDQPIYIPAQNSGTLTKLTGTPFGTLPWSPGNTYDKAFDGDTTTFFDAADATGSYTGLDLGSAKRITQIKFYPRSNPDYRMRFSRFQGSNSQNSGYVDLYFVNFLPSAQWYTLTVTNTEKYRYVRLLSSIDSGYCNVAEIEFYTGGDVVDKSRPTTTSQTNPTGTTFYVDPSGNDSNNGSSTSPFRSIEGARNYIRTNNLNVNMSSDIVVYLRGGTYWDAPTANFTGADSGSNGHKIYYRAATGQNPVISGGNVYNGGWTMYDSAKNIYKMNIGANKDFRQLYINGYRADRARTPNKGAELRAISFNRPAGQVNVDNTNLPSFINNGDVQVYIERRWDEAIMKFGSISNNGNIATITVDSGDISKYMNRSDGGVWNFEPSWISPKDADNPVHLENSYSFLDAPGEWYYNKSTGDLYYIPRTGENISTVQAIVPDKTILVNMQGTLTSPVSNVVLDGITFQDANETSVTTNGMLWEVYSYFNGWTDSQIIRNPAAITVKRGENIQISGCVLRNLGGTGIDLNQSQNVIVTRNVLYDISMNGIEGGAMQNDDKDLPGYSYNGFNPPDMRYATHTCSITQNNIMRVGVDYKSTYGILMGWVQDITIEHNNISDTPYTAIKCGVGKPDVNSILGGNYIRYNKIYNFCNQVSDGAAVYCYARHNSNGGTRIAENYIYDGVHGPYADWSNIVAVYIDDGGSGISVTNNVWKNVAWGLCNGYLDPSSMALTPSTWQVLQNQGLGNPFSGNSQSNSTVENNAGIQ